MKSALWNPRSTRGTTSKAQVLHKCKTDRVLPICLPRTSTVLTCFGFDEEISLSATHLLEAHPKRALETTEYEGARLLPSPGAWHAIEYQYADVLHQFAPQKCPYSAYGRVLSPTAHPAGYLTDPSGREVLPEEEPDGLYVLRVPGEARDVSANVQVRVILFVRTRSSFPCRAAVRPFLALLMDRREGRSFV